MTPPKTGLVRTLTLSYRSATLSHSFYRISRAGAGTAGRGARHARVAGYVPTRPTGARKDTGSWNLDSLFVHSCLTRQRQSVAALAQRRRALHQLLERRSLQATSITQTTTSIFNFKTYYCCTFTTFVRQCLLTSARAQELAIKGTCAST